jgi:hypothetical protein
MKELLKIVLEYENYASKNKLFQSKPIIKTKIDIKKIKK